MFKDIMQKTMKYPQRQSRLEQLCSLLFWLRYHDAISILILLSNVISIKTFLGVRSGHWILYRTSAHRIAREILMSTTEEEIRQTMWFLCLFICFSKECVGWYMNCQTNGWKKNLRIHLTHSITQYTAPVVFQNMGAKIPLYTKKCCLQ